MPVPGTPSYKINTKPHPQLTIINTRHTNIRLRGCATGIPSQVRLLSRFSLLLTCAGCVEIEDSSFIPFGTMEDWAGARASPWNPLVSRLRYASQVIKTLSQYLHPGSYRPFKAIQGNTTTPTRNSQANIYIHVTNLRRWNDANLLFFSCLTFLFLRWFTG